MQRAGSRRRSQRCCRALFTHFTNGAGDELRSPSLRSLGARPLPLRHLRQRLRPSGPRCGCAAGPGGSSSAGSGAATAPLGRAGLPRGSPQPGAPTRGRPGLGGAGQGLPGPELWQRSPLCSVFVSGHPKPASGNPDVVQLEEEAQIKSCFALHLGAFLPKCSHQGTEHTISRYSRIYAYVQNKVCCTLQL